MKYTHEAITNWVHEHNIATLLGAGDKIGLALDYNDFVYDNNRRHLTVVGTDLDEMIERFCEMHKLTRP